MLLGQAERQVLEAFERGLDPRHPENSQIPAKILGYGEISTVFSIQVQGLESLAFKRLPLFRDAAEVERYRSTYEEYNRLLQDEIGVATGAAIGSPSSFGDRQDTRQPYPAQHQASTKGGGGEGENDHHYNQNPHSSHVAILSTASLKGLWIEG